MAIRVLHTEWSNGYGGQEIRILSEMQIMRNLGVECALACREDSKILEKANGFGFQTFIMPFDRKSDLKTIWSLRKILQSFDILNTHSGIDTWCAGLASINTKTKFIRTRHLSNPIHPSRLNFINELADFIITTGESIREAMMRDNRIKPEKIASIPTGIDSKIFQKQHYNKENLKVLYGLPKNKIIIGNLGVMRYFKRQDIFIQIARAIHKKYPHTHFVIAGNGDGFEWLSGLIKGNDTQEDASDYIQILGYVQKPAEFLAMLDVFMLTSDKNEGVPQSLMQALLMELPCIASDIGSIKDLYHNKNFILTQNPNFKEFLQALERILNDPLIIKIDRDFISNNFSSETMGKKTLEIYQKLLRK
ncbi:MAG: glycosyltransferase family 4 protein [Helicobacter sp.]|nr:glycosyltransferase family 4 protein [Helicobacter sp.]